MRRPTATISTQADAEGAEAAAQCVVKTHQRLADWLRVGVKLPQVDQFVAAQLADLKCTSVFLHYIVGRSSRFPSYACLSVNECVVHGTAGYYPHAMRPGDILKIDIGVVHRGWVGDAAWSYVFKEMSPEVKRLTDCGKLALKKGVEQLRPGNRLIAWAQAVQHIVEDPPAKGGFGFHLVRGLGGHGYGRYINDRKRGLHAPPFVSNVVPAFAQEWPDALRDCEPGMLLAVEPMIAIGTGATISRPREWPVYIADGSASVHYEHDVLITAQGPRVLTKDLEQLPDVVG